MPRPPTGPGPAARPAPAASPRSASTSRCRRLRSRPPRTGCATAQDPIEVSGTGEPDRQVAVTATGPGGTSVVREPYATPAGTWSTALHSLPDGAYVIAVRQTDAAGNATDAPPRTTHVDRTAPAPVILAPQDGGDLTAGTVTLRGATGGVSSDADTVQAASAHAGGRTCPRARRGGRRGDPAGAPPPSCRPVPTSRRSARPTRPATSARRRRAASRSKPAPPVDPPPAGGPIGDLAPPPPPPPAGLGLPPPPASGATPPRSTPTARTTADALLPGRGSVSELGGAYALGNRLFLVPVVAPEAAPRRPRRPWAPPFCPRTCTVRIRASIALKGGPRPGDRYARDHRPRRRERPPAHRSGPMRRCAAASSAPAARPRRSRSASTGATGAGLSRHREARLAARAERALGDAPGADIALSASTTNPLARATVAAADIVVT